MNETAQAAQPPIAEIHMSQTSAGTIAASLMKRYRDAFLVARTNVLIGKCVQIGGLAIAGVIVLGGAVVGITSAGKLGAQPETMVLTYVAVMVAAFIVGVIVGLPLALLGTLVAAEGQVLKATLDTAVNSSPFLDKDQKAQIMSLK